MTRRASHGWSASVALGQRGATQANWDPRLVPLDLRSSDRVLYVVRARIVRPVQSRKPRATRVNASHAAMDAVPSKRAAKVRNGALLLARIRGAGPAGSDTPAPLRTRYSARVRPNRSRPFQFRSNARASVDASSRTENESSGPVARVRTQRGVRPPSRTRRRWRPHGAVASSGAATAGISGPSTPVWRPSS